MKILTTGGCGFLGSHLIEKLLKDDNIVIDDLSEGKLSNLPRSSRITFHKASILDDIGYLFKGVDIVYHLAALTRPQFSILHPEETDTVNVHGTLKVLEHCRDNKVKRVVFVSSSSIYGEQKKVPTPENVIPNPMSPYALSKQIGEEYCELFEKLYGLQINRIRPFNIYGTRQSPTGEYAAAVPRFIDRVNSFISVLKSDSYPVITGDGKQVRDFVYVDDVVDLMIRASKSKIYGEAFNAGSGKNISINDLYNKVCKAMDVKVKAVHIAPVFEPRQTLADIRKAKKLLGWIPKVSLEEGIERTVKGTI